MSRPRVLVVDDEPHVSRIVSIICDRAGYEVEAVPTLREARASLSQPGRVQLLLLDLKLPDGSGLDLLRELRARDESRDLPVVILSGVEMEDVGSKVEGLTGHYVSKPFSPTKLSRMLQEILERDVNG